MERMNRDHIKRRKWIEKKIENWISNNDSVMSRNCQLQNETFLVNRLPTRERDEEREN